MNYELENVKIGVCSIFVATIDVRNMQKLEIIEVPKYIKGQGIQHVESSYRKGQS
jgi:hypothetical protein